MPYTYGTPEWEEAFLKNTTGEDCDPAKAFCCFLAGMGGRMGKIYSK